MALTKEKKQETIQSYGRKDNDTGSPEVQIAMLTTRINELTEHLKNHPKDYACRRGLFVLVGKRRRLLNYFKSVVEAKKYADLLKKLNLRK
jgi:small subunit ribosomal protein S15